MIFRLREIDLIRPVSPSGWLGMSEECVIEGEKDDRPDRSSPDAHVLQADLPKYSRLRLFHHLNATASFKFLSVPVQPTIVMREARNMT